MFVFSQSGAGCLIKVAGGSVSGDLQVAACSWVPHDAFPLSHAVRNLCGMKSLSLVTLFNTASAKVLPPSTVAAERSTSTSPHPWGVPQLLSVQSAQYMVPTRAIKAILEKSLTCVPRAPLSFLSSQSLGKQVLLLAISLPFLYSSDLVCSSHLFPMPRSGIALSIRTKPSLSLLRDATHSGHYRVHRSTGHY